jgi:hypothetical protein
MQAIQAAVVSEGTYHLCTSAFTKTARQSVKLLHTLQDAIVATIWSRNQYIDGSRVYNEVLQMYMQVLGLHRYLLLLQCMRQPLHNSDDHHRVTVGR